MARIAPPRDSLPTTGAALGNNNFFAEQTAKLYISRSTAILLRTIFDFYIAVSRAPKRFKNICLCKVPIYQFKISSFLNCRKLYFLFLNKL